MGGVVMVVVCAAAVKGGEGEGDGCSGSWARGEGGRGGCGGGCGGGCTSVCEVAAWGPQHFLAVGISMWSSNVPVVKRRVGT